jgi:hypothetical protein
MTSFLLACASAGVFLGFFLWGMASAGAHWLSEDTPGRVTPADMRGLAALVIGLSTALAIFALVWRWLP